jgi:hypothetical protein
MVDWSIMKRWKKRLIKNGYIHQIFDENDAFHISSGCCFFHDQTELNEFNDIDDD